MASLDSLVPLRGVDLISAVRRRSNGPDLIDLKQAARRPEHRRRPRFYGGAIARIHELDEKRGLGWGFCYHAMQDDVAEAVAKWELAERPGSPAIPRRS